MTVATAPTTSTAAFDTNAALFSLSDFPTGWTEDDTPSKGGICNSHTFDSAAAHSERSFANQGQLPQLAQDVGSFAPGQAAAAMTKLRTTFASCHGEELEGLTWTVEPTSFPSLGDDSAAYLVTGEGKGLTLKGLAVAMRSGDGMAAIVYADFGSVDATAAESYARKALARLRAAQG